MIMESMGNGRDAAPFNAVERKFTGVATILHLGLIKACRFSIFHPKKYAVRGCPAELPILLPPHGRLLNFLPSRNSANISTEETT